MIDVMLDLPSIIAKYYERQAYTGGSSHGNHINAKVYLFTEKGENEFGILAIREKIYVNYSEVHDLKNGDYFEISGQFYEAVAVILNDNLPEIKPYFVVELAKKLN